jgi:hypothetical protein
MRKIVDKNALCKEYLNGSSIKELAQKYKCCKSNIIHHLKKQNIKLRPNPRYKHDWQKAINLYNKGYCLTDISKKMGIPYEYVSFYFKRIGIIARHPNYWHQTRDTFYFLNELSRKIN